jgi:hypothetical protein
VRLVREAGHFVGIYALYEPDPGDGVGPADFLLVPDGFGFIEGDGKQSVVMDRPFLTDGATVPRVLRLTVWLDPYGKFRKAAFLHDWAWVLHHLGEQRFTFRETNQLLYDACLSCKLRAWQAWIVWLAVTLFGWGIWTGSKENRQAKARAKVNLAGTIMRQKGIR